MPDTCWIYRLRDNAVSFSGGENTRFTSNNICDYIMLDDQSNTLFLLELKSTKSSSISLTMIRENQIKGLLNASNHKLIAGIIANFRNENNDTFFININNFVDMIKSNSKKSFNIRDLQNFKSIKIQNSKKRTHYKYDINQFVKEVQL